MQLPLMITSRDRALKAMQDIQLEGLMEIDRICRKHHIEYSLGSGTCLGQVRHGGFIPWDDDIDVDMTIDNFEKFMAVALDELDSNRFRLYSRDTEKNIFRSSARLGIIGTELRMANWDAAGRYCNVFVDIFRWNYLPDDEKKRKKVSSKLFFIHCMQHYMETGTFASKLDPKKKLLLQSLCSLVPAGLLRKYEDHLVNCAGGRTNWITSDAIFYGAHPGFPSSGTDESVDVEFEGRMVMGKKNPDNFLRANYGEHYMEWLPPARRISHHLWTKVDLGEYAAKYSLGDNYKDFMTINYSADKLRQMNKVSEMIVSKITSICEKHDINYSVAHLNEKGIDIKGIDIDELWIRPDIVMMLRDDYERFAEICREELGSRFTYQSHATNPAYYYDYARVHLNNTKIRDLRLRSSIEDEIDTGFFVKIIPLDNYIKNNDTSREIKKLRFWRRSLYSRWKTRDSVHFKESRFKDKIRLISLRHYSLEDMYKKINNYACMYNGTDSDMCFDSSQQLNGMIFDKKSIRENRITEIVRNNRKAETMEDLIRSIGHHYGACYLTYYDVPDWQLSVLRYDEKADKLLSNEELFGPE